MSDIKTCKKNLEKTLKEYYTQIEIKEEKKQIKDIEKKIKNIKNKTENDKKIIEYWNSEKRIKDWKNAFDNKVKFMTSNALLALCNPECKNGDYMKYQTIGKDYRKIIDNSFIIGFENVSGLNEEDIKEIKKKGAISYCDITGSFSKPLLNGKTG